MLPTNILEIYLLFWVLKKISLVLLWKMFNFLKNLLNQMNYLSIKFLLIVLLPEMFDICEKLIR